MSQQRLTLRTTQYIEARGHPRITALHKNTLEITKHDHLTLRGDCIIALSASKAPIDLSDCFRRLACNDKARLTVSIRAGNLLETVKGYGSSLMTLDHPTDLVMRKSDYVCGRTLMIRGDRAAFDISRKFVRSLQNAATKIEIGLLVEV